MLYRRSVFGFAVLGLASSIFAAAPDTPPTVAEAPKTIHEISRAARAALRAEATANGTAKRESAIRALIETYGQATQHSRFWSNDTLQQRALQIHHRLRSVHAELTGPRPRRLRNRETVLNQRLGNAGGNAFGANQLANGNAGTANFSQQLIELIERTITPSVWEAAGGNASMAYFHPSLALVVTADQETHRRVAGLLDALRRAGP